MNCHNSNCHPSEKDYFKRPNALVKALLWTWFAVVVLIGLLGMPVVDRDIPGWDFMIYLNEVKHVVKHIDPFDVLVGNVKSEGYWPLGEECFDDLDDSVPWSYKTVDANAPWTYTYMLPFAADIPDNVKWQIWEFFQFLFYGAVIAFAFVVGFRLRAFYGGLFVASAALSVGLTFTRNFMAGNLIMFVTAAIIGMLLCLERKWDVAAGLCWAIAISKPQDALLLGIPLLLGKKWKTIFVAASVSLLASYIASCIIGKPMLELILEVPKIKHTSELSVKLLPDAVSSMLISRGVSIDLLQRLNMLVGIAICGLMSWYLRRSNDWVLRFAPPVFCAALWTYMNDYDRCIFFLLQIVFACRFILATSVKERIFMIIMMVAVFCSCLELVDMFSGVICNVGDWLGVFDFRRIVNDFVYVLTLVSTAIVAIGLFFMCRQASIRSGAKI